MAIMTSVERLSELFLRADLENYLGPDPMRGAAEFLIGGGMAGARKRADDRLRAIFAAAKSSESKYRDMNDEEIASMLLQKFDERRASETQREKKT